MAATAVYVITGTSRGVGLELVRQLSKQDNVLVFATARNPDSSVELKKIQSASSDKVVLVSLDISDEKSVDAAVKEIAGKTSKVDVLINNAGVFTLDTSVPREPTLKTIKTNMLDVFSINTWGTLYTTQSFFPLLQKAVKDRKEGEERDKKSTSVPKVINISSTFGSIALTKALGPGFAAYRTSKACVNALTALLAAENPDVAFLAVCPGPVETDMMDVAVKAGVENTRGVKTITPEFSVKNILTLIENAHLAQSGSFFHHNGTPNVW